ncbi:MAG: LPXTG cell wall anchor domain-containing protein [Microbacterium sp.]
MRKIIFAATIAAALVLSAPLAASADELDDTSTTQGTDGYTPDKPTEPTLGGSTAIGECERDAPWISYSVTLNDPDALATSKTAFLVLSNGVETYEVELGELVDNQLSGRVLWPGAEVENGVAVGWPGWETNAAGELVETDGNYAWTRGDISAHIRVNPELAVALSYPPANPLCVAGPRGEASLPLTDGTLPLTGMDAAVLPIGIAGGAVVLVGLAFLVAQRRRRTHG